VGGARGTLSRSATRATFHYLKLLYDVLRRRTWLTDSNIPRPEDIAQPIIGGIVSRYLNLEPQLYEPGRQVQQMGPNLIPPDYLFGRMEPRGLRFLAARISIL
jgi:hypothetical protein